MALVLTTFQMIDVCDSTTPVTSATVVPAAIGDGRTQDGHVKGKHRAGVDE